MSEHKPGGIAAALFHGKDRAIAELARLLANRFALPRYGEMRDFTIDSTLKEVRAILLLRGEDRPIEIRARYRLEEIEGKRWIVAERVRTSREWMTRLVADRAETHPLRVELPPAAAIMVRILGL